MTIMCSPGGIVDIDRPVQGVMDRGSESEGSRRADGKTIISDLRLAHVHGTIQKRLSVSC